MKFFVLELGVSNSKVGKQKLEVWVSNSKFYLILDKVELVTQKNNFSFILSHFSFILTPLFSLLSFLFIFLIHCFSSSHYCTCQCFLNNYYNVVLKIMYLFLSKNWFQLVQKQPLVGILKISFFWKILETLGIKPDVRFFFSLQLYQELNQGVFRDFSDQLFRRVSV